MTGNIYQRMSRITEELGVIAKNLEIQTGKTSGYKAVSERDIIDNVKPLEIKHGVYSYPAAREVLESNMLESESEVYDKYEGKTKKITKTTFMSRIKTIYRFVNVDDPTDYIETTSFAEGFDAQDKGSGKAMTYADKYALMKAYKISTGDDPDAAASEQTKYTVALKKEEKAKEGVVAYSAKNIVKCPNCGNEVLREWSRKNNKWMEPEEVLEQCGGVCLTCYREAKK